MKIGAEEIRTFYNEKVRNDLDYENGRWFKTPFKQAGYEMSKKAIEFRLEDIKFQRCLEVGPGPGTWTELLMLYNPSAKFDLIDISKEMLAIASSRFKGKENLNYFESDFLAFHGNEKYDFFFSSRAIEYMPEKEKVIVKIRELLDNGSAGLIVTKNPKYWRYKITRQRVPEMHKGQISPSTMKRLLEYHGFSDVSLYPSIMIFPKLHILKLDKMLFRFLGKLELNFISRFFSESYVVFFKKR